MRYRVIIIHFLLIFLGCTPSTQEKLLEKSIRKATKTKGEKSEYYCKQILQYDSLNTFAYNRLGLLDIYDKKAIDYFQMSLSIDSNQAPIWYQVGYIYMGKSGVSSNSREVHNHNALDSAITCLSKAIDLDSTSSLYYYQRSFCYTYSGKIDESKDDLQKACSLGDNLSCQFLKKMD